MEKLGFYPLTILLSYLTEKEAVILLSTKRKFAWQVLPIFQESQQQLLVGNNPNDTNEASHRRKRYQFKVSPIQDPNILLDRLNSRRLYKRRRHQRHTEHYYGNATTSEIANLEWQQQEQQQMQHSYEFLYPPELELLRFKSFHNSGGFQNLYYNNTSSSSQKSHISLLVSYPRSGNTLVRTLLERTTGYVTGSDTRPDRSLSKELAEQHNLVGEGIVSANRVIYVKTHYPERFGHQIFDGHSAVVVVRNPYDAIDSYWNMNATKSHTKSLVPEIYEQYNTMWCGLVRNEIHVWNKFLEFWLRSDHCRIPVLIVRFEDLIRHPSHELQRILEFTIRQNRTEQQQQPSTSVIQLSKYWLSRIDHCTISSSSTEQLGSYQPRSATSGKSSIGKSLRSGGHYTDELIDYIHDVCAMNYSENYLRRFGYDVKTQEFPNNFIYSEDTTTGSTTEQERWTNSNNQSSFLRVNDSGIPPIRSSDCPYGRLLQQWRHSVTDNDRNPLPTVPK